MTGSRKSEFENSKSLQLQNNKSCKIDRRMRVEAVNFEIQNSMYKYVNVLPNNKKGCIGAHCEEKTECENDKCREEKKTKSKQDFQQTCECGCVGVRAEV